MDARTDRGGVGFGELNFGETTRRRRRTRRLVRTADRRVKPPHGTLPDKLHPPAVLKGLYRRVHKDQVSHASVLAPHRAGERQHMQD